MVQFDLLLPKHTPRDLQFFPFLVAYSPRLGMQKWQFSAPEHLINLMYVACNFFS